MDSDQIYSILVFLVCATLSAFFSASETAFTSLRKTKLKLRIKNGDEKAKNTLKLSKNYENLLSSILIGNNLVNIAASSVATVFFVKMSPHYGPVISTIVTTIVLLFFSEVAPKLIAKLMPEDLATKFTGPLKVVMIIFSPLVWIMSLWQALVRNFIPHEEDTTISEDELLSIVDEAKVGGSIEAEEHILVKAAIEFDDVTVAQIIVPRVDVVAIEIDDTDEKIEEVFDEHQYSRVLVYEDTVDKVIGMIRERDFHRYLREKKARGHNNTISSIISDVLYVPEVMKLSELLKLMQKNKTHMAAVIDEHGGLEGIVTMEDLLEELVGDIWDESDEIEHEIRVIEKNKSYEVLGRTYLEEVFEKFGIEYFDEYSSNTLAGFVVEMLDKMPHFGDSFIYENHKFIVKEVENNRVEKVIIKKI